MPASAFVHVGRYTPARLINGEGITRISMIELPVSIGRPARTLATLIGPRKEELTTVVSGLLHLPTLGGRRVTRQMDVGGTGDITVGGQSQSKLLVLIDIVDSKTGSILGVRIFFVSRGNSPRSPDHFTHSLRELTGAVTPANKSTEETNGRLYPARIAIDIHGTAAKLDKCKLDPGLNAPVFYAAMQTLVPVTHQHYTDLDIFAPPRGSGADNADIDDENEVDAVDATAINLASFFPITSSIWKESADVCESQRDPSTYFTTAFGESLVDATQHPHLYVYPGGVSSADAILNKRLPSEAIDSAMQHCIDQLINQRISTLPNAHDVHANQRRAIKADCEQEVENLLGIHTPANLALEIITPTLCPNLSVLLGNADPMISVRPYESMRAILNNPIAFNEAITRWTASRLSRWTRLLNAAIPVITSCEGTSDTLLTATEILHSQRKPLLHRLKPVDNIMAFCELNNVDTGDVLTEQHINWLSDNGLTTPLVFDRLLCSYNSVCFYSARGRFVSPKIVLLGIMSCGKSQLLVLVQEVAVKAQPINYETKKAKYTCDPSRPRANVGAAKIAPEDGSKSDMKREDITQEMGLLTEGTANRIAPNSVGGKFLPVITNIPYWLWDASAANALMGPGIDPKIQNAYNSRITVIPIRPIPPHRLDLDAGLQTESIKKETIRYTLSLSSVLGACIDARGPGHPLDAAVFLTSTMWPAVVIFCKGASDRMMKMTALQATSRALLRAARSMTSVDETYDDTTECAAAPTAAFGALSFMADAVEAAFVDGAEGGAGVSEEDVVRLHTAIRSYAATRPAISDTTGAFSARVFHSTVKAESNVYPTISDVMTSVLDVTAIPDFTSHVAYLLLVLFRRVRHLDERAYKLDCKAACKAAAEKAKNKQKNKAPQGYMRDPSGAGPSTDTGEAPDRPIVVPRTPFIVSSTSRKTFTYGRRRVVSATHSPAGDLEYCRTLCRVRGDCAVSFVEKSQAEFHKTVAGDADFERGIGEIDDDDIEKELEGLEEEGDETEKEGAHDFEGEEDDGDETVEKMTQSAMAGAGAVRFVRMLLKPAHTALNKGKGSADESYISALVSIVHSLWKEMYAVQVKEGVVKALIVPEDDKHDFISTTIHKFYDDGLIGRIEGQAGYAWQFLFNKTGLESVATQSTSLLRGLCAFVPSGTYAIHTQPRSLAAPPKDDPDALKFERGRLKDNTILKIHNPLVMNQRKNCSETKAAMGKTAQARETENRTTQQFVTIMQVAAAATKNGLTERQRDALVAKLYSDPKRALLVSGFELKSIMDGVYAATCCEPLKHDGSSLFPRRHVARDPAEQPPVERPPVVRPPVVRPPVARKRARTTEEESDSDSGNEAGPSSPRLARKPPKQRMRAMEIDLDVEMSPPSPPEESGDDDILCLTPQLGTPPIDLSYPED